MIIQKRLQTLKKPKINICPYNKSNSSEQWIRISSGCPNDCPFCYEPIKEKVFDIPKITKNKVKIMDMNLLSKDICYEILTELKDKKVNNKVVYYELICGIDWRFLTPILAELLKKARFKNIRLAWDFNFVHQKRIKKAIDHLFKANFNKRDITIFMICNWKISFEENLKKLDLCKVWNIKVSDCYFDNQLSPNIIPIYWNDQQIKEFRSKVRKHNQLVNFKIDPEVK